MAETANEPTETNPERVDSAMEDMDLVENLEEKGVKRARGEEEEEEEQEDDNDMCKKQKSDKSVEEERLEKHEGEGEGEEKKTEEEQTEVEEGSVRVSLGPKSFGSSVEMLDCFFNFLHFWPPNLNVNKVLNVDFVLLKYKESCYF